MTRSQDTIQSWKYYRRQELPQNFWYAFGSKRLNAFNEHRQWPHWNQIVMHHGIKMVCMFGWPTN
jgi:hypothetical protein